MDDDNELGFLLTPTTLMSRSVSFIEVEVEWPFGKVDIDPDDLRETAYEILFTSCRSSPGFGGGKNALNYYPTWTAGDRDRERDGERERKTRESRSPPRSGSMSAVPSSTIKRALGLKTTKRTSPSDRMLSSSSTGLNLEHPKKTSAKTKQRPLTTAELVRQQMKVTEQFESRLKKTLMRTLVGQMSRKVETIIIPLELLRHLKPSEFQDAHEYYLWQRRQLKIIEAGLLQHPSIPLDRSNAFAMSLRDIVQSSESKAIDTGKSSEAMKNLNNAVLALAWRSQNGTPAESCHWANGFPLNIHLYITLLQSIFDPYYETAVLDEVDELMDLMKKTWSTLGINKSIHNILFTWVLFHQFIMTGQVEPDLLSASTAIMADVATDAKRSDREFLYVKILSSTLASMKGWAEKKLLNYHEAFQSGAGGSMGNIIPLAVCVANILEDVESTGGVSKDKESDTPQSTGNRIDLYIKSSMQKAFNKILESKNINSTLEGGEEEKGEQDSSENLIQLARETEESATREKEYYSSILKRWQPIAAAVAAVTLHNCYGAMLRQYLTGVSTLTINAIHVLRNAGNLENVLLQMVVEDSVECEDGGKGIVREMEPYEVDSVILNLMKSWLEERLKKGRECLENAKETETWNPKSKTEPHAQSVMEIMKLTKEDVDDFFKIPAGGLAEDLTKTLSDGIESLLQDYTSFVQSCGTKQGYIPPLPPLTRCSRDSKIIKLWKKASPCRVVGMDDLHLSYVIDGDHPRPSTSRGTQRLYIRINTLYYLLSSIHSLDKSFTQSIHTHFPDSRGHHPDYFELTRTSIQTAIQYVSEVAAFRLIFLDSSSVFYDGLYAGDVTNARIHPALRILKQNLTLLIAILNERAQPMALKEVMKATFEVFLMVLLAGGSSRMFSRTDHDMIAEDFGNLKRVFCTCGEGLIPEEVVEKEADIVEGVVALMGKATEKLVEDLTIIACETSGIAIDGATGHKVPMPPTTGRWERTDPNTILRVLCHRNDHVANSFLKKTFHLAKRR